MFVQLHRSGRPPLRLWYKLVIDSYEYAGIDCLVDLLSYRLSELHVWDCLATPARSALNY